MRKARAYSAASVLRAVALGAALCAAAVAPGCTHESFNLLQVDAAGAPAAGATSSAGGAASAGDTNFAGGASGANDLDAGAGKSGKGGSRNGLGGFHGGAGASTAQAGGGGSQEPCLAGDQCVDGGLNCPPTVQGGCKRCTSNNDCDGDAPFCDIPDGRCAECLHPDDCPVGDVCHPLTLRCMHSCNVGADCVFDHDKPQCDMFHTCVSCNNDADCHEITGHQHDVCAFGTCVDCYDDWQCPPQRQYCVGLVCQTKR